MEEPNIDGTKWKVITLGILSTGLAALFGWTLQRFLNQDGSPASLAIYCVLWFALMTLHPFLVKGVRVASGLYAAQVLAFVTPFYASFSFTVLIPAALLFATMIIGFERGHKVLENNLNIEFYAAARRASGALFTGLALFAAIYVGAELKTKGGAVSKDYVRVAIESVLPLTARLSPGVKLDGRVGDVIKAITQKKLGLSQTIPVAYLDAQVQEIIATASDSLGVKIEANETLPHALEKVLTEKADKLSGGGKLLLAAGLGVLLFFTLKGIGFFLNFVVVFLAFLAYHVLLGLNVIHIGLESRSKEVVIL